MLCKLVFIRSHHLSWFWVFERVPMGSFEYKVDFLWCGELGFTPTLSSFASYDSMWSKFNALFVDYPMGHFTVGLLGKGMVTIWCCIGANIKGLITKPLWFLGGGWGWCRSVFWMVSICAEWKQLTMRWSMFFIVCVAPNPDGITPLFALPWQLP